VVKDHVRLSLSGHLSGSIRKEPQVANSQKASYSYDFASGGVVKVEVDPQWMEIIGGFDRAEHANDEYNRRLSIKLGNESQHEPDPCEIVCRAESMMELLKKLGTLTDRQREVLSKRYAGMSIRAIAKQEGYRVWG
jgi:hypothetical protein